MLLEAGGFDSKWIRKSGREIGAWRSWIPKRLSVSLLRIMSVQEHCQAQMITTNLAMSSSGFIRCGETFIDIRYRSVHGSLLDCCASKIQIIGHQEKYNLLRDQLLYDR